MTQLENEIKEIRIFLKNKKCGLFLMTVVLMFVYGIRAVHDNFYIDSEIMFLKPEFMDSLWLGSNWFGLVLMAMCFAGIALSYASWKWCGCSEIIR